MSRSGEIQMSTVILAQDCLTRLSHYLGQYSQPNSFKDSNAPRRRNSWKQSL
jgi:hypothetical protein